MFAKCPFPEVARLFNHLVGAAGKCPRIDPSQSCRIWLMPLLRKAEGPIMRTYYFDMKDGVPIRDRTGLRFSTDADAIKHSKELARRFSHDHRLKEPIHTIIV